MKYVYLIFSLFFYQASVADDGIAKTLRTEKSVTAQLSDQVRVIKRGDGLSLLDTVKTGPLARASFRFHEGTVLTLGENSEIKIREFESTEQNKNAHFDFVKGAFRMITGSITKTDSPNFTVNTPSGAIGVRGTDFWGGNLSNNKDIDVILLDSEHELVLENEYGKVTIKQPGYGTTLTPGKAPTTPKKWPEEKLKRAVKTISFKK